MKECPQCGGSYPDSYEFCPTDGVPIGGEAQARPQPAQIRVKTLMLAFIVLVLCAAIAFTAAFLYLYWKPKYGSLTIKTTPPGAFIFIDGKLRGASPITVTDLLSGGHQIKGTKEGYRDLFQQVNVLPYSSANLHWNLDPVVPQLNNEQLAAVEALTKKLDTAQRENILLPPPDDYNVLYFANRILEIDPANAHANEVKAKLRDTIQRLAELAYAREDWLEAEKQYKNLLLLLPDDVSVGERIADVAAKIDASIKDREKQIQDWQLRAEAALKIGNLVPPEKENALEAIRSIQRLDKNNSFAREAIARLKELLQNRGDNKIAASDWQGAYNDFTTLLKHFPEDTYSKNRLETVRGKLAELAQLEQQRTQRTNEEEESRRKLASLRQSALHAFSTGSYQESIAKWTELLHFEPNSDEAYFYIGASYQDQKQLDTAILNFEKCLSLNPSNVLAHLNLGMLYDYHRNNYEMAEKHLRRAKDLGGASKYTPDFLQTMIEDLQDRAKAGAIMGMRFPVDHKHAFSSCRGYLQFTPQGVEFRSPEVDHSFYESYKGLRAFELKGAELSIRTGSNKKYNFQFVNAGDAARVRTWNSSARLIQVSTQSD